MASTDVAIQIDYGRGGSDGQSNGTYLLGGSEIRRGLRLGEVIRLMMSRRKHRRKYARIGQEDYGWSEDAAPSKVAGLRCPVGRRVGRKTSAQPENHVAPRVRDNELEPMQVNHTGSRPGTEVARPHSEAG